MCTIDSGTIFHPFANLTQNVEKKNPPDKKKAYTTKAHIEPSDFEWI